MLASLAPDLDGLSLLFGIDAYHHYHHLLAHNLTFGLFVVLVSLRWIERSLLAVSLVATSFLLHLVGDYFGSGPGWGIRPWIPFSDENYLCAHAWSLGSWQNHLITTVCLAITVGIGIAHRRTPLEVFHINLDRTFVGVVELMFRRRLCSACGSRAKVFCSQCASAVCEPHVGSWSRFAAVCTACGASPATSSGGP